MGTHLYNVVDHAHTRLTFLPTVRLRGCGRRCGSWDACGGVSTPAHSLVTLDNTEVPLGVTLGDEGTQQTRTGSLSIDLRAQWRWDDGSLAQAATTCWAAQFSRAALVVTLTAKVYRTKYAKERVDGWAAHGW